jgi:TonB-linked SusC/RagA family outer membrane protein
MKLLHAFLPALAGVVLWASPTLAQDPTGSIAGRVLESATQRPLAGASVVVDGTRLSAVTRADGSFLLGGVPAGRHTLRVDLIGYGSQTQEVTVAAGETVSAELTLQAAAVALDELVVVGYGTQRRRDLTGAVASVNVQNVQVATTANLGQILQGRVAGAQVIQNNGAPGGGISIRIRGTNSITANSEPLYVIDGIPAVVGTDSQDPYQNPLSRISPSDIESIEILKDASATAIYGARGGPGVVLVTTKRGQRGVGRMTLESTYGVQSAARKLSMLNGRQFAEMANEARSNAGLSQWYTAAEISALGAGTDWQDMVLQDGALQTHALSFSGGDERTRYLVSGSFYDQEGIVIGSEFRRYSGRVNLDRNVTDRLTVGSNLTVSNTHNDIQQTDNSLGHGTVMGALWFNPASPVFDDNGNYIANSPFTWPIQNPVATARELLQRRSIFSAIGNVFGEYELGEGLRFRTLVGVNAGFERYRYFAPSTIPAGSGTRGNANQWSGQSFNLVNENILTYGRAFGSGQLDLTGGFTVQTADNDWIRSANEQFANDLTGVYSLQTGTRPTVESGFDEWSLLSYLGRANYSLSDRYIFTLTGRYDGSSRFGANSKWGFFPSVAFAWRIMNEPFLQNSDAFSDLKLRLSYGMSGNQEIGTYRSLARMTNAGANYAFGGNTVTGFRPDNTAPNPDLKWETTRQLNAGFDLGWLDNRITASIDAYHSVTDDLLLEVQLPATSGFANQVQNVGSVQNRGVELSLSTVNLESARFSWRSTLNVAANRNKVKELGVANEIPGPDKGIGGQTGGTTVVVRVGEPLGAFLGLRTDGLYQIGDPCPLTTLRPTLDCEPGEYRYVDTNGDGRIDANDRVILGHGHPDFYGGLSNTISMGRLDLNVFLNASVGNDVLNGAAINIRNVNTFSNQTTDALNRWTAQNTNTNTPRANANRPREIYDVHVEDGSYLRLQQVSLGYRMPAGLIPGASSLRVYVSGENLHVWTKYSGFDPEVNSFGGEARSRGIDLGAYPRARTVNVGVNVSF